MILYFAKHPTFDLIGTASTSQTDSIYFSDNGGQEGEYQSVAGGYRSYGATVYFRPDQSAHVKEMTAPGNYILYKDRNGDSAWLTILTCEHDPLSGYDTITAEDASMDLINETVGAYSAPKAMTIADYINLFVTDSGFEIGVNEIPTLTRTLKWESEEVTALNRILSVATQFDVELSFRFEISGLTAVKKYIDIRKRIGRDRRTELTVDSQLNNLVTSTDVDELYTSVYATGATPEGANQPISLKGYSWTDPDGRFVLKSDGSLRDPVANQSWSRLPAKDSLTGGFINRVKTYEAQTQATLLQSALNDLKQHNHPTVTYSVDIAILPDDIQVGDTVHLRDEKEQLFLTARVLELTYSYSTESGTATLGDYLIEASEVDPAYRALAEELAKQNKGKDGVGLKSSVVTYQAGTSGTTAPNGTWVANPPSVTGGNYLWTRTVWSYTDGTSETGYSVAKAGDMGKSVWSYPYDRGANRLENLWSDLKPTPTTANPPKVGDTIIDLTGNMYQITNVAVGTTQEGGGTFDYGPLLTSIKGAQGPKGDQGPKTFIKSATAPSTTDLPVNAVWVQPANGATPASAKTWDGANWQDTPIESSLIADNIIGKNITGSTFGNTSGTFSIDEDGNINGALLSGYEIKSTFSKSPLDLVTNEDNLTGSGTVDIKNGTYSVDGTIDQQTSQAFRNYLGPAGIFTNLSNNGSATNMASLSKGELYLYYHDGGATYTGVIDGQIASQIDNIGMLLWQGKTQLGDNQSITPRVPLSQCLNGWKIGLAIDGGNRFFWYYLSKEKALEAPNLGHLVPIFDFNAGGGGQYYYVSDTKLTGNTSINLNNSVGSNYYIYEIRAF